MNNNESDIAFARIGEFINKHGYDNKSYILASEIREFLKTSIADENTEIYGFVDLYSGQVGLKVTVGSELFMIPIILSGMNFSVMED